MRCSSGAVCVAPFVLASAFLASGCALLGGGGGGSSDNDAALRGQGDRRAQRDREEHERDEAQRADAQREQERLRAAQATPPPSSTTARAQPGGSGATASDATPRAAAPEEVTPLPDPTTYDYRPATFKPEEINLADPPAWLVLALLMDPAWNGAHKRIVERWRSDGVGMRKTYFESTWKKNAEAWEIERGLKKPVFLPHYVSNAEVAADAPPSWANGIDPASWPKPGMVAGSAEAERRARLEKAAATDAIQRDEGWNTAHDAEIKGFYEKKDTAYKAKVAAALKGDIKAVEILSVINDPASYAGKTVKVVGMFNDVMEGSPVVHADDLSGGEAREALVVQVRPFMKTDDACFALDGAEWTAKADFYRGLIKKRVEMIIFVKGPPANTKAPCIARVLDVKKK